MWEKLNKLQLANVVAIIAISGSFGLAFISAFHPIPKTSEPLINKVIDLTVVGVVGWLFTKNKNG